MAERYIEYSTAAESHDENVAAVVSLVKLYSELLQQSIFNCLNSGYGYDTTDAADATGEVCVKANAPNTFKCRIHFRFRKLFNSYAGAGALTFD